MTTYSRSRLLITIGDERAGMQTIATANRGKAFPLLARVEIAEDVGEIPIPVTKYDRMQNKSGGQRSAERRGSAIPRMVVASGGNIVFDGVGCDIEFITAEVTADVDFVGAERW